MSLGPPRLAERLLERVIGRSDFAESLVGDLREEYRPRALRQPARARVWYWVQALRLLARLGLARLRAGSAQSVWRRVEERKPRESMVDTLIRDLGYAMRLMRKRPAFSALALLTLALGIGSTTAIFSMVDGVLIRALPYGEPERLVSVQRTFPHWRSDPARAAYWQDNSISYHEFREWRAQQTSFESVAGWVWTSRTLRIDAQVEVADVLFTSASLLDALRVRPQLGRNFRADEEGQGAVPVAMISDGEWRTRFGGAPDVLGRRLELNGVAHEVVGVLPREFHLVRLRQTPGIWVPAGTLPWDTARDNFNYSALGRLQAGVSRARALEETNRIFQFGLPSGESGAVLVDLRRASTDRVRAPFLLLLLASGLLLLITCVNVAALLLGEGAARDAEVAARLALGAGRRRILQQLLTEQVLLALAGAVLGLFVAHWTTRTLVALAPPATPRLAEISVNLRSFAFALMAAGLTASIFGLVPALALTRTDAGLVLRAGSSRLTRRRSGLQRVAMVVQLALAVVLLVGGTLLVRSLQRLADVSPGFQRQGVYYVEPQLSFDLYPDPLAVREFYRALVQSVRTLPGVRAVSAGSSLPFTDGGSSTTINYRGATVVAPTNAQWRVVMPGFFQAMGLPIVSGRANSDADRAGAPRVVLISQTMAQQLWPQGALGQELQIDGNWHQVVGVVSDVKHFSLQQRPQPTFYLPFEQTTRRLWAFVLQLEGESGPILQAVQDRIHSLDANVPVRRTGSVDNLIERTLSEQRFRALITAFFAVVAGLLVAAGLYGVTADAVTRRMREMAIRLALGASERSVVRLAVRSTLLLGLAGVSAGALVALLGTRPLRRFLFGITSTDLGSYSLVIASVLLVTAVAAWLPARRAARAEPAAILRAE
jgi:predicted permease